MVKISLQRVLCIIMNLTRLERIKTELKHAIYEINKKQRPTCDYLHISGTSKQESRDTTNSAREKIKGLG
jgi:hypothetical protein